MGNYTREMPTISSVASPEPNIVTVDDNSNGPTFPYGFGAQQPIVPPSLNDINLPSNPFNMLAVMTVVQQNPTRHDNNYSPQSPEPSEPSPISTPLMNLSTIGGWETLIPQRTTTDEPRRVYWASALDETFNSEGEPRRIYLLPNPSPPLPSHKMKRKLEMGTPSPKRSGVSQHVCEACGKMIPPTNNNPRSSTKD